jgi:hypothetical protein
MWKHDAPSPGVQIEIQLRRLCGPPVEYCARSEGARCGAEAGVLRKRFAREYAAGTVLGVLQGHARRVVEGSRCLASGDGCDVYCVEDVRPELERSGLFEFPEVEPPHDGGVRDRGGAAAQVIDARFHAHAAVGWPRYRRLIELGKPVARTSAAEAVAQNHPTAKVWRTGYVDTASAGLVGVTETIGRPRLHRENAGNLPVVRDLVKETASACDAWDVPGGICFQVIRYGIQRTKQFLVRRLIGPEGEHAVSIRLVLSDPGVALE